MDVTKLNKELREKFEKSRTYENLEKYVMSELLSPIENYDQAIKIIEENKDLINSNELYFISAYLCSEWFYENNNSLQELNHNLKNSSDIEKSIIYYLNAYDIICKDNNWKNNKLCFENLSLSVKLSKGFNFANNLYYLSYFLNKNKAKETREEALNQVTTVQTDESLEKLTINDFLSPKSYINEFILGIDITEENYSDRKEKIYE